jgi:hypothetical protein
MIINLSSLFTYIYLNFFSRPLFFLEKGFGKVIYAKKKFLDNDTIIDLKRIELLCFKQHSLRYYAALKNPAPLKCAILWKTN